MTQGLHERDHEGGAALPGHVPALRRWRLPSQEPLGATHHAALILAAGMMMAAQGLRGSCWWALFWAMVVLAGGLAEAVREAPG
jgi:hypothetical protein